MYAENDIVIERYDLSKVDMIRKWDNLAVIPSQSNMRDIPETLSAFFNMFRRECPSPPLLESL